MTDDAPAYVPDDMPSRPPPGSTIPTYDKTFTSLPADLTVNAPRQIGTATAWALTRRRSPPTRRARFNLHGYVESPRTASTRSSSTPTTARVSRSARRESPRPAATTAEHHKRAGNIALSKGKHEITIDYFANDDVGANNFGVAWAAPDFHSKPFPPAICRTSFRGPDPETPPLAPSHT